MSEESFCLFMEIAVLGEQAVRISTKIRKLTCQLSVNLLKSNEYIEEVSLINSWAAILCLVIQPCQTLTKILYSVFI
jgi:hypothetical protein